MRLFTSRKRALRALATVAVTGLAVAYLVWKIDVGTTLDLLGSANAGYFLASLAIMLGTVLPFGWRWQRLLEARGVRERLPWLLRAYLVSYTAGQVLPTSLGGDAARIYETARRHPGAGGAAAGSVLLERALGGTATLLLAAVGFALALGGGFDVGAYLWVEALLVAAAAAGGVVLFSRAARRPLRRLAPLLARVRLERPARAAYEGLHAYRRDAGLLLGVFALTLAVQAVRVLAIWLAGKAVGVDLSPRPYYVMGPLLFLVMLVPFTVNGLAVRESFFVSFLGTLGIGSDAAFATGFLFFVVTIGLSLPGAGILAWEGLRGAGTAFAALDMSSVSVVVTTYNSAEWIERCLASVAAYETVVVDHGSSDDTVAIVRRRFPQVRLIEAENRGFGAGMNTGMRAASGDWFLLLNSDAWAVGDAVERLVAFGEAHPRAAVVGPRLRWPDGRLQRSARGFPTLWRLATEYLYLRKLAPRTRLLNAFYAGGFDHDRPRRVEWLFAPALLVRRAATEEVGLFDEDFFMFSEEVDWCWRFHRAGWEIWFTPDAEVVHVGGGAHRGRLYVEYLRGHLRFLAKHRGPAYAERARRLLLVAYVLRTRLHPRAARYREALAWLRSERSVAALLEKPRA